VRGTAVSVRCKTKLTVRAPAHYPAAVDVRVQTATGTSATSGHDRYSFQQYRSVSVGFDTACAIRGAAALGDGHTTASYVPVKVH
jgi:hypothetical protein